MRGAKIGSMGYRDMLLYGTQCDGTSLRSVLGIELEPFEMLEMVQNLDKLSQPEVDKWKDYVNVSWRILNRTSQVDETVERGVRYAPGYRKEGGGERL